MNAVFMAPADPGWPAFLEGVPHDFYHTPEYTAMAAAREGGEAAALRIGDSLLAPMLIQPLPGGRRDARTAYGYPSPLLRGTSDPQAFREALRAAGIVSYFSRVHPLLPPPELGADELVENGENVIVDLTRDLWAQTRSGHRSDINRLRRSGFTVVDGRDRLPEFVEIYSAAMTRLGAAPIFRFGLEYFATLLRLLDRAVVLLIVRSPQDEVAAAALFSAWGEHSQYLFAATRHGSRRGAPSKMALYEGLTWARSRGALRMNLGGGTGSRDDSLFRFKCGFSDQRAPSRTIRMILDVGAYRELSRGVDPGGYFPAYRAGTLRGGR